MYTFILFYFYICRYFSHRIECTLFGPYVDELNTFLASVEIHNVVVIVQFAKVKSFQGIIAIFIINVACYANVNSLTLLLYY